MKAHTTYVAYFRVSTEKQGRSGLGLDAQRSTISAFVGSSPIIAEFEEVESGTRADRPELAKALAFAKKHRAVLVVAALSRLGRSVAFVASLIESGVPFAVADMPNADKFRLHIEASVDEAERDRISERTRKAMAEKKAKGATFGGYRGGHATPAQLDVSRKLAHEAVASRVEAYITSVMPHIVSLQDQGLSATAIADALTKARVPTSRGSTVWQTVQVQRLLARVA